MRPTPPCTDCSTGERTGGLRLPFCPGCILALIVLPVVAIAGLFADPQSPASQAPPPTPEQRIGAVLDDLHDAAAKADFNRYFAHYHPDSVFLGTDASERWTKSEFQAYARPRFDEGGGWTYHPRSREVVVDEARGVAWFDELLDSPSYGLSRGSGTMLRTDEDHWRIAQYHLTYPIPNDLAEELTARIRAWRAERGAASSEDEKGR